MRTLKMLALALGMLAFSGAALRADSLVLGSHYSLVPFSTGTEGGGSIDTSYLNGMQLPYVYCVQINAPVYPSKTYNDTMVNTAGTINGGTPVPNAGEIAYLLTNYGTGGQGDAAIALQAAIWHVEGFGNLGAGATSSQWALYDTYLTDVGTAPVSNFLWMTPGTAGSAAKYQGLVTTGRVPDGGATLMLLGGALVGLATLRRKFRA